MNACFKLKLHLISKNQKEKMQMPWKQQEREDLEARGKRKRSMKEWAARRKIWECKLVIYNQSRLSVTMSFGKNSGTSK